jgi:hypothetical protein
LFRNSAPPLSRPAPEKSELIFAERPAFAGNWCLTPITARVLGAVTDAGAIRRQGLADPSLAAISLAEKDFSLPGGIGWNETEAGRATRAAAP